MQLPGARKEHIAPHHYRNRRQALSQSLAGKYGVSAEVSVGAVMVAPYPRFNRDLR
jgi:hypothetical protein